MQSLFYEQYKSRVFHPVFDSNMFQVEFKLDSMDSIYNANTLRICNVGVQGAQNNESYNIVVGSLGVVKTVTLYDGNVVLDQLRHANYYQGFRMFNTGNDHAIGISRSSVQTAGGIVFKKEHSDDGAGVDFYNQPYVPLQSGTSAAGVATAINSTCVFLQDLLPLLTNVEYLSCNIFKNLRLVIEYGRPNQVLREGGNSCNSTKPFIICDEWDVAPALKAQINKQILSTPVSWWAIEHDSFNVPQLTSGTGFAGAGDKKGQLINAHPRMFNGKLVGTLLMINTGSQTLNPYDSFSPDTLLTLNMGSSRQHMQSVQVAVNSVPMFANGGLTNPAERLALLHDTCGTCHQVGNNVIQRGWSTNLTKAARDMGNNCDYTKFSIGNRVSDLRIDFGRLCVRDGDDSHLPHLNNTQKLTIQLFAEVRRTLQFAPSGQYIIAYV